jgi:excisionase family DNA binding protein
MSKNLILLEKDDLKEIIYEIMEKIGKDRWVEKTLSDEGEFLTRDEVCSRLHITTTTLWRLEKKGDIKAHRIGRRCLYSRKDVDVLVAG